MDMEIAMERMRSMALSTWRDNLDGLDTDFEMDMEIAMERMRSMALSTWRDNLDGLDTDFEMDMEIAMERMRDLQHMLHSRDSSAFSNPLRQHRQATMRTIQDRQMRMNAVDDADEPRRLIRAALIEQASSSQPEETRERALRALADDAMQFDQHRNADHSTHDISDHYYASAEHMWSETKIVLTAGAAEALPCAMRELALRAIGALVFHRPNSISIWADSAVRRVLLAGAAVGQPEPVRFECHRTLSLLACESANSLFADDIARAKVIEGATPGEGTPAERAAAGISERVRNEALDTFKNALNNARGSNGAASGLARLIWDDLSARTALLSCAAATEPDRLRVQTLEVLKRILRASASRYPDIAEAMATGLKPIILEIATSTAASAVNVRSAALVLMCYLAEKAGPILAADGNAVAALLAAAEGEQAVLSGELRQRCAAAHERLEAMAEEPNLTSPLRLRPRYSSLKLPVCHAP